jgi:hypothetical protein
MKVLAEPLLRNRARRRQPVKDSELPAADPGAFEFTPHPRAGCPREAPKQLARAGACVRVGSGGFGHHTENSRTVSVHNGFKQ